MILSLFKKVGSALLRAIGFIASQVVLTATIPFEWTVALIRKEPRKYEDVLADVIRVGVFALISVVSGNVGFMFIAAVMIASMSVELWLNTKHKVNSVIAWVFLSATAASPVVTATEAPYVKAEAVVETSTSASVDTFHETAVVYDIHEPLPVEGGLDSIANMTPVDTWAELPADTDEALAIMLNPEAYKAVDTTVTLSALEESIAQHAESSRSFWNAVDSLVAADVQTPSDKALVDIALNVQPEITISPEDSRTLRDVGTKAAAHARDLRERLEPGGKGIVYPEGKI